MVAPLALNGVDEPAQIVAVPLAVTVGTGFTVTITVFVFEQPEVVPVTVYVVVALGESDGLAIAGLLTPVVGLQLYVDAPLAVTVADEPAQMLGLPDVFTFGNGVTDTGTVAVAEHPRDVPVTV